MFQIIRGRKRKELDKGLIRMNKGQDSQAMNTTKMRTNHSLWTTLQRSKRMKMLELILINSSLTVNNPLLIKHRKQVGNQRRKKERRKEDLLGEETAPRIHKGL
jgi:hypothetical protein